MKDILAELSLNSYHKTSDGKGKRGYLMEKSALTRIIVVLSVLVLFLTGGLIMLLINPSGLNPADLNQDERLNRLISAKFPETSSGKQGVLLRTEDIPQDDLLLALIFNEAKVGQSGGQLGVSLLVLDKELNIIGNSASGMPLSPCYTAQTLQANAYTITFGCTDHTKWLSESDKVVPVDIRKVKAVYDNGTEVLFPVQNNSYICWAKGTPDLVGLYFYNADNELQADHTEIWGPGLGMYGAESYTVSPENVVKGYLKAKENNDYEAWKAALWPALKNDQNFTPTFEKPGDLSVLRLSIERVAVSEEETQGIKTRYTGSELARSYNWSDDYIAQNMIVVSAQYTVDYDNTKVPYQEGALRQDFILIREYTGSGSSWLIWDGTSPK